MLSDEEREALEILKGFEPDDLFECAIYLQALEKITNLIEKQQKEIEHQKEKIKEHKERITFLENKIYNQKQIIKYGVKTVRLNVDNLCKIFDLISKNKIKAKLEELKDGTYDAKIILQKLLEE